MKEETMVKLLKYKEELIGNIICLYLPVNLPHRPRDLFRVLWNNGKTGIVELKDIEEIK